MTGMEDSNVALGQSILEVLQIADRYNLRELLDNQDELLLDFSNEERQLIIRAYFSLIQRASGFISGLVIVLHDVTEQQRIEEERRQFVSNVSHELRTPLTSVKSYVDALQEGCLLYTSDAADEEDSVDLGGGRIIKKKKQRRVW